MSNSEQVKYSQEIRLRSSAGRTIQNAALKKGISVQRMVGIEVRKILAEYPDNMVTHLTSIDIRVYVPDETKRRICEVCSSLNVSVSDFLKIKLYDKLIK